MWNKSEFVNIQSTKARKKPCKITCFFWSESFVLTDPKAILECQTTY